jgi:uncharacterized membrane protein YgcG
MFLRKWLAAVTLTAGTALGTLAADPIAPVEAPKTTPFSFGVLRSLSAPEAKAKVEALLKAENKLDTAKLKEIWDKEDKTILDRTIDSLALAYPEAKALITEARSAAAPAPTEVPAFLKNDKLDPFVRSNVAAAYVKALASKRVYEETIAAAKVAKHDQLVDPSAFLFFKAVAEHGVAATDKTLKRQNREAAIETITKLLDDVIDSPDRYKMVATLMFFDIQGWSKDPKDLANIGKLMDNSGRRLDLARGDEETQRIQKDIVFRLDEKIKELENKNKGGGGGGGGGGGQCPSGGSPGGEGGKNPQGGADQTSVPNAGPNGGKVDEKQLRQYAEQWGKLPASERAKAMQDIKRDLPAKFKPMIEEYFKSLNRIHGYEK